MYKHTVCLIYMYTSVSVLPLTINIILRVKEKESKYDEHDVVAKSK